MKNILKKLTAISCVAVLATGMVACNEEKEIINAYDIAVKNGFVGTEEEWLSCLKGKDGEDASDLNINDIYESACAEGYRGTFLEFLSEYLDVNVQEDNDTATIAENMLSVVSIYCGFSKTVTVSTGWPQYNTKKETQYYASAGSGVIIDLNKQAGNALIVTNYHVIYDSECDSDNHIAQNIYLYGYGAFNMFNTETGEDEGGEGMLATYVGGAMDYDIAILKVEGSEYIKNAEVREATIGNSDTVQAGEKVFAIGNPDGAGIAVTNGVVSVDSEYIQMSSTDGSGTVVDYRVMRTDAAINHGNSGGALFNAQGELIGITNAKNVDDEVDNMGYALPITQVKYLCENILDNGGVLQRAMLGVMVRQTDSSAVYQDGRLSIIETFEVDSATIENTAAAYRKLKYKDQIVSITIIPAGEREGEKIELARRYQLNDLLLKVRKGDTVVLGVIRDGSETDVTIVYDQDSYFVEYN